MTVLSRIQWASDAAKLLVTALQHPRHLPFYLASFSLKGTDIRFSVIKKKPSLPVTV